MRTPISDDKLADASQQANNSEQTNKMSEAMAAVPTQIRACGVTTLIVVL
jgi:hypothetical protein